MGPALTAVYAVSILLFLCVLLSLGFQPKRIARLAGVLLFAAALLGTALFGYGYWVLLGNVPLAAVRTLFSVFCMFLGRNETGGVSSVPLLAKPGMQALLYLTHLLAMYCTTSAVVGAIGVRLIRTLNLLLIHRGDLSVIYGVSPESAAFGEQLARDQKVLFIDTGSGAALESRLLRMGSLMLSPAEGTPGPGLLRRLGIRGGKRALHFYCLDADPAGNLGFARAMAGALEEAGIPPERTALTVILPDEEEAEALQAREGRYGYGSVLAYEREQLMARLLVRTYPPCETLRFDGRGRAAEDFQVLMVGFGRTGQAVLRALVMNGQFAGSRFRAVVVAREPDRRAGSFFYRFPGIRENYDIEFIDADARSVELYRRIAEKRPNLNYTVLCTGSEKENGEIAQELRKLYDRLGIPSPILQCTKQEIRKNADPFTPARRTGVFTRETLCGDLPDAMAKLVNHAYHLGEGRTAEEDWADCGYFSRMSCRAAADYAGAFLAAAGRGPADFRPEGELLENLAESEHERWCAFHYAMGYLPMPREVWERRAERYREEVKAKGSSGLRIGKDPEGRLHACLIPWSGLAELSRRENAVTGGSTDYPQMDRDNVLLTARLLQEEK